MTTTPARTSTKSNCGHTSCSWTFVWCSAAFATAQALVFTSATVQHSSIPKVQLRSYILQLDLWSGLVWTWFRLGTKKGW